MVRDTGDWHLDAGRNPCPPERFHAFLDLAEPDQLILGGDTLELWAFEWWEVWQGPYQGVIERIRERTRETIILIGNHDGEEEVLKRFFPRADVRISLVVGNRLIIHGHQYDPLLDDWYERWTAHNFDRAFTMINLPWLNALREKIADKDRTNDSLILSLLRIYEEGRRYLLHHSHVEVNRGWYANPGSPLKGPFPYIELEENGDCTLRYLRE